MQYMQMIFQQCVVRLNKVIIHVKSHIVIVGVVLTSLTPTLTSALIVLHVNKLVTHIEDTDKQINRN